MEILPAFSQVQRRACGHYTGCETHADAHTERQASKVITKSSPNTKIKFIKELMVLQ